MQSLKIIASILALSSLLVGCATTSYQAEPKPYKSQRVEYKKGQPYAVSHKRNTVKSFAAPSLKVKGIYDLQVGFLIENHTKQAIDLTLKDVTVNFHETPLYIFPYDVIHKQLTSSYNGDVFMDVLSGAHYGYGGSAYNPSNSLLTERDFKRIKTLENNYLRHTTIEPGKEGRGVVYVAMPKKLENDIINVAINVGKETHRFRYHVTKTKVKPGLIDTYAAVNQQ